ncbi:MAG: endonuclease III [Deinococcales bacterium]
MPKESKKQKLTRANLILQELLLLYPNARTELKYNTPFELLVSTILSAQATDVSVNAATPALFERYPDASALANAQLEDVENLIRTIGLYRNKAKNIIATAKILVEKHNGGMPNDFEALLELPGVGRKTATVVLSNAFDRPGIAVDTHVGRLARRFGFSVSENPDIVETDLEQIFPKKQWIFVHHALILHGRQVCDSRKPKCGDCRLLKLCKQIGVH